MTVASAPIQANGRPARSLPQLLTNSGAPLVTASFPQFGLVDGLFGAGKPLDPRDPPVKTLRSIEIHPVGVDLERGAAKMDVGVFDDVFVNGRY
jgi:hypothetical protein